MKVRFIAAAASGRVLAVAAVGVTGASGGTTAANNITVWLQVDAQTRAGPDRRGRERSSSSAKHPGVDRRRPVSDVG